MHELRRLAYLDAMGVASFISRHQLPGAATTRRLGLATRETAVSPAAEAGAAPADLPELDQPAARRPAHTTPPRPRGPAAPAPEQFTLATVLAGDWLWLEDIGANPLGKEQVWLIQCMARALTVAAATPVPGAGVAEGAAPEVALFQWPIHTNDQFDLGPESAQASAGSFVARRLESGRCRGLVCLGAGSGARLAMAQIEVPVVATHSTVELLSDPALKPVAWRQLAPLIGRRQAL